jgi:hypothetical protein
MKTTYGSYEVSCQKQPAGFKFVRRLALERIFFPVEAYPAIRAFFQNVRAGDEQQVVLQSTGTSASN